MRVWVTKGGELAARVDPSANERGRDEIGFIKSKNLHPPERCGFGCLEKESEFLFLVFFLDFVSEVANGKGELALLTWGGIST